MSHLHPSFVLPLVLFATLGLSTAVRAQSLEFSDDGNDSIRIENEAKLRVPDAIVEEVWTWLQEHYQRPAFLDRDGHTFKATFGDEQFFDTYFDDPEMHLFASDSGVRHRRRVVHEGSAMRKDGRALLQIKLSRNDATGLNRSEIKYKVDPPTDPHTSDDLHDLLGLVARNDRDALKQRMLGIGIDPYALQPVLTIEQNRRRVYVADQKGSFATLTLDKCWCVDHGAKLHWTEIELELNEIRFTESTPEERAWMDTVNKEIQKDLLARFPTIVQDQTPKYSKAFKGLEASTWLPLRTLQSWRISTREFQAVLGGGALAITLAIAYALRQWRRRATALATA